MAVLSIRNLERPKVFDPATADEIDAPFVRLELVTSNGEKMTAILPFADYEGMEAEWEAGSATTILQSALNSWLATYGFVVATAALSSVQRSWAASFQPEIA